MSEDATQAFALRESVKDLQGATVACGSDGETLDVLARLKAGDGVIVTSNPAEIHALQGVDVLKTVPVPAPKKSAATKES